MKKFWFLQIQKYFTIFSLISKNLGYITLASSLNYANPFNVYALKSFNLFKVPPTLILFVLEWILLDSVSGALDAYPLLMIIINVSFNRFNYKFFILPQLIIELICLANYK